MDDGKPLRVTPRLPSDVQVVVDYNNGLLTQKSPAQKLLALKMVLSNETKTLASSPVLKVYIFRHGRPLKTTIVLSIEHIIQYSFT